MLFWVKRGKFSIVADMLEVADGGAGKTQIMYGANLNFRRLQKYLRFMLKIDLLDETSNNGRKVYGTTRKGITFLQHYYAIKELLKTKDDNSHKNGSEGSYTITKKLLLSSAK